MKRYSGRAPHEVFFSTSDGDVQPLPLCLDIRNHSPTGFSWGYAGSGPSQLALALCVDSVGKERALRVYQEFKFRAIATIPGNLDWELTDAQIRETVRTIEIGKAVFPRTAR